MKKRKIRIKPRFWVFLAMFVFIGTSLWGCGQKAEKPQKINVSATSVEYVPQEINFILNIPLPCELQEELYEASKEFGVDYYIMLGLIDRETKFNNVLGDGGASYGYCQIQPKWWYGLMAEIGATDLNVPEDNFRTACAIMAQLTEKYQSVEGALVAYNQGYYKGYSTQYSREVIANAEKYRAEKCRFQDS